MQIRDETFNSPKLLSQVSQGVSAYPARGQGSMANAGRLLKFLHLLCLGHRWSSISQSATLVNLEHLFLALTFYSSRSEEGGEGEGEQSLEFAA